MTKPVNPEAIVLSALALMLDGYRISKFSETKIFTKVRDGILVLDTSGENCPNNQANLGGKQGRVNEREGLYLALDRVVPPNARQYEEVFTRLSTNDIGAALIEAYVPKPYRRITNEPGVRGTEGQQWFTDSGQPNNIVRANQARQALKTLGLIEDYEITFLNMCNRIDQHAPGDAKLKLALAYITTEDARFGITDRVIYG